jgi:uncharacterized damage-inducible protein DinB
MRRSPLLALAALLVLACPAARAQMASPSSTAMGAPMPPSKALDDMLNLLESELVPAAEAMPADKYDFAPSQAIFIPSQHTEYATVRTFGQQVAHLAEANYYFFSSISETRPEIDPQSIMKLKSKAELVAALKQSFAYAHHTIATITPENAFVSLKGVDGMHTRTTVAGFAVAHGFDHYGQMVEYLRMNGIVPPASAK